MIDRLPVEIIRMVVQELVPGTHFETRESLEIDGDFSYDRMQLWSGLVHHRCLGVLAMTCQRLKSVVYPLLFSSMACCAPEHNYYSHYLRDKSGLEKYCSFYTKLNSALHQSKAEPAQFMLALSNTQCLRLSPSALSNAQSLCLNISLFKEFNKRRVSKFFRGLTALKDLTVVVEFHLVPSNKIKKLTEELLASKAPLRLHLCFNFFMGSDTLTAALFEDFLDTEWASWTSLDIEFLGLNFFHEDSRISPVFFQMAQKFKSLKAFVIKHVPQDGGSSYELYDEQSSDKSMHKVELTDKLKNVLRERKMTELSQDQESHETKWTLGNACTTNLAVPLTMFNSTLTFEKSDNITQLEVSALLGNSGLFPPFRKLKTLGLYNCFGPRTTKLLEHFVQCNSGLTKLLMDQGSLP